jgi:hypothetical protein
MVTKPEVGFASRNMLYITVRGTLHKNECFKKLSLQNSGAIQKYMEAQYYKWLVGSPASSGNVPRIVTVAANCRAGLEHFLKDTM